MCMQFLVGLHENIKILVLCIMDRANRANRALTDPNLFKRKEVRLARGVSDLMLWPYTSMVSDLVVLSPASRPCTRLVKF